MFEFLISIFIIILIGGLAFGSYFLWGAIGLASFSVILSILVCIREIISSNS